MTATTGAAACPDENVLVALADGALSDEARAAVERHLDDCAACTRLVRELAGLALPARPVPERYRIVRQLGAGAMGVVWEAEDTTLGRRVALKFITPEGSGDRERRERLIREARALAKLRHPNVIAVHDAGETGDEMFLALELVDGTDARTWRAAAPRSRDEILAVWRQAAAGLAAVHAAGLVHRDVKPDNVLVASDGRVLLGDFGLATGAPGEATTLTQTGAMLGTPLYMAPEQLDGAPATERSDQFALCASIWEALAGARPFPGSTIGALAVAMTKPPVPPGRDPLFAVLARGLAADPAERWPDVDALAAALAAPPRPRRTLLFAIAGAGIAAAIATAVVVSRRGAPGDPATPVAPHAPDAQVVATTGSATPRDTQGAPGSTTPRETPGAAPRETPGSTTPRETPGAAPRETPGSTTPRDPQGAAPRETPGSAMRRETQGAAPRETPGSTTPRATPGPATRRVTTDSATQVTSATGSGAAPGAGSPQVRITPPPIPVLPPRKPAPAQLSEWRRILDAADDKLRGGDGPGCLALMATIPPVPATMEDSAVSTVAICTMIAGDCLGGRDILLKHGASRGWSRERAERWADGLDGAHCAIDAPPSARWPERAKGRLLAALSARQSCKPVYAKIAQRSIVLPGKREELAMLEVACHVRDGECAQARAKHATVIVVPPDLPPARLAELEANRRKVFDSAFSACANK